MFGRRVSAFQSIDEVAVFAAAPSFAKLNNFAVGVAPRGVTIDKAGNVFVANQQSNDVVMYDSSGNETAHFKVGRCPENMAVDSKGDLWVTNACSSTVTEIKGAGACRGDRVGIEGFLRRTFPPERLFHDAYGAQRCGSRALDLRDGAAARVSNPQVTF